MAYTVKKLAEISGVSVRTLHFYDEIGLLKPAYYGSNGYRYYEEQQLLMLQQILFFRELDFELKQIENILGRSDFDKVVALTSHREVLKKRGKRIRKLIKTIDKTIVHLKGDMKMSNEEMYDGFDKEKQAEYEKYLIDRYGDVAKEKIAEAKKNTKGWGKKENEAAKKSGEAINEALSEALAKDLTVDSEEVQKLIQKHYEWIQQFYEPTKEIYINLGKLYYENSEFNAYFSKYHPKMAEFLADAMKIFAERNLA